MLPTTTLKNAVIVGPSHVSSANVAPVTSSDSPSASVHHASRTSGSANAPTIQNTPDSDIQTRPLPTRFRSRKNATIGASPCSILSRR